MIYRIPFLNQVSKISSTLNTDYNFSEDDNLWISAMAEYGCDSYPKRIPAISLISGDTIALSFILSSTNGLRPFVDFRVELMILNTKKRSAHWWVGGTTVEISIGEKIKG